MDVVIRRASEGIKNLMHLAVLSKRYVREFTCVSLLGEGSSDNC